MAADRKFATAVHILTGIAVASELGTLVKSKKLAESVNTNPAVIRKIIIQLTHAGIVESTIGKTGGFRLIRSPKHVKLLDIYIAVSDEPALDVSSRAVNKTCMISCNIKEVLKPILMDAEEALKKSLSTKTLGDVVTGVM
ncbi:MAG: Rrf2 family transcriptional regulator [bacterium]|nr:MAG: Rrf2 family transcriptional regulator [bacterium]